MVKKFKFRLDKRRELLNSIELLNCKKKSWACMNLFATCYVIILLVEKIKIKIKNNNKTYS